MYLTAAIELETAGLFKKLHDYRFMRLKAKREGKAVERQKNKNFNTYCGLRPELNSKIKMADRTQSGFPPVQLRSGPALRGNDKYGIPASRDNFLLSN